MSCRKVRSLFIDAIYDELDRQKRDSFDKHLRRCKRCSEEYSEMCRVAEIMTRRVRAKPSKEMWERLWDEISRGVVDIKSSRPFIVPEREERSIGFKIRWIYGIAAALGLILGGLLIWRSNFRVSDFRDFMARSEFKKESMESKDKRIYDLLLQSKVLILALNNFDPEDDTYVLNMPYQRKISQRLLKKIWSIRSSSKEFDSGALEDVVCDLEVVLLQIANSGDENERESIEMIREGIERLHILFRINMIEMKRVDVADGNIMRKDRYKDKEKKDVG